MAERLLHHGDITGISKGVAVNLAECCLFIISGASLSALGEGKVVGVVLSGHGLRSLQVVEGLAHGATLASRGLTSAVKSLLDREGRERALLHTKSALKSTDCGESPVRATDALVNDVRDVTVGSPVDRVGNNGGVNLVAAHGVFCLLLSGSCVSEQVLVLLLRPVTEFVVGDLVVLTLVP